MKHSLTILATAVTALVTAPFVHAQNPPGSDRDPFTAGPPNTTAKKDPPAGGISGGLSVRYETFSVDLASAASMMRAKKGDGALYQLLVGLADTDKAKQESLTVVRTRSGQRATSTSFAEYIYPTEWEPAEIPNAVGVMITPPPKKDGSASTEPLEIGKLAEAARVEDMPHFLTPATATSFEVRNLGFTLEVEALLGADNETVSLSIAPEHAARAGSTKWGHGASLVEAPAIEAQKVSTQIDATLGAPRLIGTMNRPPVSKLDGDSANRVWFAFVTVTHAR
jgi:hypothetical protein